MKWLTLPIEAEQRVLRSCWPAMLVYLISLSGIGAEPAAAQSWKSVNIPDDWKQPAFEGMVEYRCRVAIPVSWRNRELSIFLEGSDDARQCLINGQVAARIGEFPPEYRSGLGNTGRFDVSAEQLRFGAVNDVQIRVYRRASRDNFNLAAPALFAGDQAIHLRGQWLRLSDAIDPISVDLSDPQAISPPESNDLDGVVFEQIEDAAQVESTLQQLSDERGPLEPSVALAQIQTAAGLHADLVLSDPHIGQPLSMKWDERGRLWVSEYLQYPDPAGLKMVSRDRYLRTVYDRVPPPPPEHFVGADRISIHEDTDGDGHYDAHQVFVDGLNLSTSFALGRGGVFVLNPPYLLFYPDRDNDDVPDGDPQVLLEGFGLEDSHSIANSLRWGPDGWLYAAQGSTVTGNVRRYGSDDPVLHSMGQLIWRYHPETRRYEIFAEGGGNAFGVEIDNAGRIYSGHNGGDTRGFHYVQGGYFQKSFGKHGSLSNPYAFGYFSWMKHHSVPRFSHTFVIYEGGSLPKEFDGKLFGVEPLNSRVVLSDVFPDGSTFRTQDTGYAMTTQDVWCRPVDIQIGPDGAVYVADFYEQRIDHSSHYQGRVDKESGRIYRLRGETPSALRDLSGHSNQELVKSLDDPNRWVRQTALRMMADRQAEDVESLLLQRLRSGTDDATVGTLWALYQLGRFDQSIVDLGMRHANAQVRKWTVRLACDQGQANPDTLAQLKRLAEVETDVEVRSQLASSMRRLSAEQCLDLVDAMGRRAEDAADPHVPLLIWWALESYADTNRDRVLSLVANPEWRESTLVQQYLLPRIMRRFATTGKISDLQTCAQLLEVVDDDDSASALLAGFDEAFRGRLISDLPVSLGRALSKHRGASVELKLQLGDRSVLPEVHRTLADGNLSDSDKIRRIRLLAKLADPSSVDPLWKLASGQQSDEVKQNAIHSLQGFADAGDIGQRVIGAYGDLSNDLRESAGSLLASRLAWSQQLVSAVDDGAIAGEVIDRVTVDKMRLHANDALQTAIDRLWGPNTSIDATLLEKRINHYRDQLDRGSGNPYAGRTLFQTHCGKCHTLFDQGGDIGPDLTPYKRSDLYGMLVNILNPSLEIREGFETFAVFTLDGLAVSGFVAEETPQTIVLKQGDGQSVIIERDDIDEMDAIGKSVMPDGILDPLKPQQVRDLFAYLRATQPLP